MCCIRLILPILNSGLQAHSTHQMALNDMANFLYILDPVTKWSTIKTGLALQKAPSLVWKKQYLTQKSEVNKQSQTHHNTLHLPPYYLSRIPLHCTKLSHCLKPSLPPSHDIISRELYPLLLSFIFFFACDGCTYFLTRTQRESSKTTIQVQAKAAKGKGKGKATIFMGPNQEPTDLQTDRGVESTRPIKEPHWILKTRIFLQLNM